MAIKLSSLLANVGYGTPVIVINQANDEELLNTKGFIVPYSLEIDSTASEWEVLCIGIKNGVMLIWVNWVG